VPMPAAGATGTVCGRGVGGRRGGCEVDTIHDRNVRVRRKGRWGFGEGEEDLYSRKSKLLRVFGRLGDNGGRPRSDDDRVT